MIKEFYSLAHANPPSNKWKIRATKIVAVPIFIISTVKRQRKNNWEGYLKTMFENLHDSQNSIRVNTPRNGNSKLFSRQKNKNRKSDFSYVDFTKEKLFKFLLFSQLTKPYNIFFNCLHKNVKILYDMNAKFFLLFLRNVAQWDSGFNFFYFWLFLSGYVNVIIISRLKCVCYNISK